MEDIVAIVAPVEVSRPAETEEEDTWVANDGDIDLNVLLGDDYDPLGEDCDATEAWANMLHPRTESQWHGIALFCS